MHRAILASLILTIGCAPSTAGTGRRDSGTAPGMDGGQSTQADGGGTTRRDAGRIPFDECAREVSMAETRLRPVDIVWIIDNSGSMSREAEIVQNNMNAFASTIGASGIDYRVVVMTRMGFVEVPAPLGTDTERFLFADVDVQSHDGLIDLVNNFGLYSDFLRPEASLHFVVVTDDESSMGWMDFRSQMETVLGRTFTFHTIASPPGSNHMFCPPLFPCITEEGCAIGDREAENNGDDYWALSEATGGQRFSICTDDWSGLFAALNAAIAVPTQLPCRYVLPEPPDGMTLDRNKVNVLYTPSGTSTETVIPYVREYGSCGPSGGWYYAGDDILVCPATCDILMADESGRVEIALGCETILI
jgi:hypothetical protein